MAAGVYRRGLTRVAGEIDQSPSKLSEQLAGGTGGRPRDVGLQKFEEYLEQTKDYEPIYYLIDKFLGTDEARQQAVLARVESVIDAVGDLPTLLASIKGIKPR